MWMIDGLNEFFMIICRAIGGMLSESEKPDGGCL